MSCPESVNDSLRVQTPFPFASGCRDAKEESLLAQVPPIRPLTDRLIDEPAPKSFFWDPRHKKSWHLRYPEMTQLQLDAFFSAAEAREEFTPGGTPLWALAMKYFPPRLDRLPREVG